MVQNGFCLILCIFLPTTTLTTAIFSDLVPVLTSPLSFTVLFGIVVYFNKELTEVDNVPDSPSLGILFIRVCLSSPLTSTVSVSVNPIPSRKMTISFFLKFFADSCIHIVVIYVTYHVVKHFFYSDMNNIREKYPPIAPDVVSCLVLHF